MKKPRVRLLVLCLVLLGGIAVFSPFMKAQERPVEKVVPGTLSVIDQPSTPIRVGVSVRNDVSPALRDIPPVRYVGKRERHMNPNPKIMHPHVDKPDPIIQDTFLAAPGAEMPAAILNFDGIPFPGVACNCAPPDTDGEVGATQYVQIVNEGFQVFNKATGASVLGPVGIQTVWSGFGGNCENYGDGDPIVLYDQLAGRWLISQFAGASVPTDECIAVSTTSDATGSWYRYDFNLGANFYDYPKIAVWPDAYYMAMNVFNAAGTAFLGPQPYAFDRAAMLAGNPATFITPGITVGPSEETYLPADLDGSTLPAQGAPATFVEFPGGGTYKLWHFHVDFVTPGNSTFTLFASPAAAGFTALCTTTRACVPELGVASGDYLDAIADRLMFRLAYRKFADHESVVGNFTVSANSVAGIRWFELRDVTAGPVTVYQESTYQPDTTWRWMGSAAMDTMGNVALGYSASDSTINPQIRYAGRLVTDPVSTLPQAEVTLFAGTGSQSGTGNRWGDYSAMSIDPVDDCTFWYTQEYYATSGTFNWRTRIGNFKFPSCTSVPTPVPVASGSSLVAESFPPGNGVADPGERVTVTLTVANVGTAATTNLVGTLQNTGGVTLASAPQTYGAIAGGGGSVSRTFSFTASGACGGSVTATLNLQDGATGYSAAVYTFTLGTTASSTTLSETFDGVTAPALPAGWTTTASGAESPWVTSTTSPFSGVNDAFAPDPSAVGLAELLTPAIAVPATGTQVLSFKNNYITESGYDGMVLEMSIDGGAFADITTFGTSFISGGYNATISTCCSNALGGRSAWTGSSGTYVTSSITLPAAALGHNVQLKWRMGSDSSISSTGVRIDSVTITSSAPVCAVPGTTGDFNGDFKADILWRNSTQGDVWLWPMDGASKVTETYVRTVSDTNWEIRGLGDYNGDGMADMLWRNKVSGLIYLWPMNGATPLTETYVATVDTAYDIVGTGDFNADGRSDLLWRHTAGGDLWIWLMNGASRLSEVYVDTVAPAYVVKGVRDLDGDQMADIVWHGAAGDVWLWLMNGTSRLSQNYVGTVPDTHYQIQQVADFDGNGKADILWWNTVQGDVWIWPMNGATIVSQSYVGTVPDTNYRIVGAADYNHDTKADILWRNVSAGDVWIWLMNGTTKSSENYVGTVADLAYQIVNVR